MTPDNIYAFLNLAVLPAWALLLVLPRHRITQRLIHAIWIPLLLTPLYVWALFFGAPEPEGAGFGDLQSLMILFQSPTAVIAGWVHYLVFDLFIGAWIVRDAGRHQMHHGIILPCILGTMLFGPVGLAAYLLLRLVLHRRIELAEEAAPAVLAG